MLEVAAAFGADQVQGYQFAKPMPVGDLRPWMTEFSRAAATDAKRIQTFAGALAYHWRYMHMAETRPPHSACDCPVGRFLDGRADCAEGIRLHRLVHDAGPEGLAAAQPLLDWLAARVTTSQA